MAIWENCKFLFLEQSVCWWMREGGIIGRRRKKNEITMGLGSHTKEFGYFPLGKKSEMSYDECLLVWPSWYHCPFLWSHCPDFLWCVWWRWAWLHLLGSRNQHVTQIWAFSVFHGQRDCFVHENMTQIGPKRLNFRTFLLWLFAIRKNFCAGVVEL